MALLDKVVTDIRARVDELAPAVAEHAELTEALTKLNGHGKPTAAERKSWDETWKPEIEAQTKAVKRSKAKKSKRGRGRPKGSGPTIEKTEKMLKEHPGVTVAELADLVGIKPNYLYRVLPTFEKEGKAVKREGHWWPAGS